MAEWLKPNPNPEALTQLLGMYQRSLEKVRQGVKMGTTLTKSWP